MSDSRPSVSVIVVTLNRPDCVRQCLLHLQKQTVAPLEVIVVDGSKDKRTSDIVAQFEDVQYIENPLGYGHMTHGRNLGLLAAHGQILAFLDDDSYAHPTWLEKIVEPYSDAKVGAVGGRALRGTPDEATKGADDIGTFKSYGFLGGNFGADSLRDLDVFHLPGCNMSFRRDVLSELGGLRDDYTGTEVREETDVCCRVGKLGWRVVWTPFSVVDHVAAPQAKGKRLDWRYHYFSRRNHIAFLGRNFGLRSLYMRRYFFRTLRGAFKRFAERPKVALFYFAIEIAGFFAGLSAALVLIKRDKGDFRRRDTMGQKLRDHLGHNFSKETIKA
ncbi:glycosyltransferase [bacterium]|nr:MAG: glycosyltransferase [bacterium]